MHEFGMLIYKYLQHFTCYVGWVTLGSGGRTCIVHKCFWFLLIRTKCKCQALAVWCCLRSRLPILVTGLLTLYHMSRCGYSMAVSVTLFLLGYTFILARQKPVFACFALGWNCGCFKALWPHNLSQSHSGDVRSSETCWQRQSTSLSCHGRTSSA